MSEKYGTTLKNGLVASLILFGKFKSRNMYRLQNLLIPKMIKNSRHVKRTVTDRIHIEKLLLLKNCKLSMESAGKQFVICYKICL